MNFSKYKFVFLTVKIATFVDIFCCISFKSQPKLNERDIEREKLRKENQLLRDRLNSMHEQREREQQQQFTQSEN